MDESYEFLYGEEGGSLAYQGWNGEEEFQSKILSRIGGRVSPDAFSAQQPLICVIHSTNVVFFR